jgi:hypothetical protein
LGHVLKKSEGSSSQPENISPEDTGLSGKHISRFYEEYHILKSEYVQNLVAVTVRRDIETHKRLVEFDSYSWRSYHSLGSLQRQ